MATLSPETRLKQLTENLSARDAFELMVLTQVVAMPGETDADRQARLVAWQTAMRQAPE